MDITSLQAFIAVARHQSFSKASESLFVTQPAISKRVAALEDELKTELFNRVSRQISLTESGKVLLPQAKAIVQQADELQRIASSLNQEVRGSLSIAIAHHIGLHRMPPILARFSEEYPDVELGLRFEDSDQAFHLVEQGDIEFAVITLPSELPKALSSQTIWQDELAIMVSAAHQLATQPVTSVSALAEHACLLPETETETYQIISRIFESQKRDLMVQMQTNNLETLKMLTAAGLGWSLLPTIMADETVTMLKIDHALQRKLGLVTHQKRSLSKPAQVFKEMLLQSGDLN